MLSLGTCVGRFTKTERFHISITFLDYLAQYALYKVGRNGWVGGWVDEASQLPCVSSD